MRTYLHFLLYFAIGCLALGNLYAQEGEIDVEESAEVFLEEYSDEFQETFFEALKQKGIENYDRAINLLLKCKNLDPNNKVVDAELAKAYYMSKEYISAQEYAINAVNAAPENIWYLSTLVDVVQRQGTTMESVHSQIPYGNIKLKENLALIYYRQRKYTTALNILKGIKKSSFAENLTSKINDSIAQTAKIADQEVDRAKLDEENDPVDELKEQMNGLIAEKDFKGLEVVSLEAMESFPSQPYFYYVNGVALNKNGSTKEAIEVLKLALDYTFDDVDLTNKIYSELANAYNALGNSSKANIYLSKIKSGL
ncbi:tetratricopeptide (TPR) repeat protein [Saonia flava]|uniref:Tetratricopeptide (TPR) repeat protein n=1 Tax=Saonia flava TaxID=523696 RepID=A0A846QTL7_9FLAO|nr:hypothetical protein [Saonia flava]NJB71541.1 tetratricopeptide (TPR) repeat protein [Saonia flava]